METDIKVTKPKRKVTTKVVADVVMDETHEIAPSVETGVSVVHEEPHHGKLIAITIVSVLVIIVALVGVSSLGDEAKKADILTGNSPANTTPTSVVVPTETFIMADTSSSKSAPTETGESILKSVGVADTNEQASPANFKAFSYDATAGEKITVSGTCHDTYYALLIFGSNDDYRASPDAARANRAFECGSSRLFTIKMDLRDINLPSGEYYIFVADQGKTGTWYNPR